MNRSDPTDVKRLAQQTLGVMQLDLGYHRDYTPRYNRDPIRHQLAWLYASEALGEGEEIYWISPEQRIKSGGVACRDEGDY